MLTENQAAMTTKQFKPISIEIKDEYTLSIFQQALEEEQQRVELRIARITFKINALRTRDISDLPPSIIKEWEENGIIKNGKLVADAEPIKLLTA
jgi:hypothetical protein